MHWPGAAMDDATPDCAASTRQHFSSCCKDLKDPRQPGRMPTRARRSGYAGAGTLISATLAVPDAEQFQRCFVAWVAALTGTPETVIGLDDKTSRRSGRKPHATRRSTWFRPSQPASAACWVR